MAQKSDGGERSDLWNRNNGFKNIFKKRGGGEGLGLDKLDKCLRSTSHCSPFSCL